MANKYAKIGAAWINENKDGGQFISIQLDRVATLDAFGDKEKVRGYLFENEKKESEKQPDYIISIKLDQ